MIPLKGEVPTRSFPLATVGLIALNAGLFVRAQLVPPEAREAFILDLALIPQALTRIAPFEPLHFLYNVGTLFTSMFVHAGAVHLAGNMLYLWIFGGGIEDVVGRGRFVLFYLLCGIAGSLAQVAVDPSSGVPVVGASGAIAGLLAAYMVMFPTARVLTLVFLLVYVRLVPIPALIVIGIWLLLQLVNAGGIAPAGIAWFAHLGGFCAGLILIVPLRRKRIRHSLY
jgi:membrane associated rhomboid family serine protease